MKYLIVSGMDESHDREHDNAGCPYQYTFFNEIILKEDQRASINILKTYNKILSENKNIIPEKPIKIPIVLTILNFSFFV